MSAPRRHVLGLDLSLTSTGICRPDGATLTVKTWERDGDRRLGVIEDAVLTAARVDDGWVDLAVLEDIPKTSFAAKPLGMVHGVVRNALNKAGIPYAIVTAATLKAYATGGGSGTKVPMAMAAYKRAGLEFANDDECDAWWLRTAGLDRLGQAPFSLPQAQRDRLDKIEWPDLAALLGRPAVTS